MTRTALAALLLLAAAQAAPDQPPEARPEAGVLKRAVENTPRGARARAVLTNEAGRRVDELVAALKHADDDVRVSAAWGLRYSANKAKAVGPLTAALRDENFSVARAAAVSLNHFDAAAGPLADLMADADSSMRWRGVINVDYVARQLSPAARAMLSAKVAGLALGDPVDFIRTDSAWTLRHFAGEAVAEALTRCLADPSGRVRGRARDSLLRGAVSRELRRGGSPVRRRVLAALLEILESHRGKSHATQAAVNMLTELVVNLIGPSPARWRKLVETMEARP